MALLVPARLCGSLFHGIRGLTLSSVLLSSGLLSLRVYICTYMYIYIYSHRYTFRFRP